MRGVTRKQVRDLMGKSIYAVRKDGSVVTGKLVRMHQNKLFIQSLNKGKKVQTKAILPLVLFDLLAVGTAPYAYGGYGGYGYYGGIGGIGGFGGGYGGIYPYGGFY